MAAHPVRAACAKSCWPPGGPIAGGEVALSQSERHVLEAERAPVAAAPAAARLSGNATLAILAAGVFLAALDQTVVVAVLYQVQIDYELPPTKFDQLAWVITAYLLGYT